MQSTMDSVWDAMNAASRVSKQIEGTETLVPRSQQHHIKPVSDLQELAATVNGVRTTLVPFVTAGKKSKVASEQVFDLCLEGIKETLREMFSYFKDLESEFSIYTWKTQKVKLYQMDFLLRQKLDQFAALFNPEESEKKSKGFLKGKKSSPDMAGILNDDQAREFWCRSFGDQTQMVPWAMFFQTISARMGQDYTQDEEFIKMFINFSRTDNVSVYELSVFLKMFGPFVGCVERLIDSLRGGLLGGFVPAVEANLLLEGKKNGTFVVRCSKTNPGSFAVTFVDSRSRVKHCLLYAMEPGLSLKNPPTVYESLNAFADAHASKLKHPLGNRYTLKKKIPGFQFGQVGPIANDNAAPAETASASGTANNATGDAGLGLTAANGSSVCVVCMDAPFQTVFLECGHLACCVECSDKLKLCPICRNPISRVVPIFPAT